MSFFIKQNEANHDSSMRTKVLSVKWTFKRSYEANFSTSFQTYSLTNTSGDFLAHSCSIKCPCKSLRPMSE